MIKKVNNQWILYAKYQNQGYGSAIIQQMMKGSPLRTIHLSVLKNNPAFKLYIRLGFEIIGEGALEFHMQSSA